MIFFVLKQNKAYQIKFKSYMIYNGTKPFTHICIYKEGDFLLILGNAPLSTCTCFHRACLGSRHFCTYLLGEGLGINCNFNHLHEQKTAWLTV